MSDCLPPIPTIPNAVAHMARLHADAVVIEEDGLSMHYGALHEAARCAARALMALGVAPGERVAVWAPNLHEWIVAALGIQMAGGVLVPLNTRLKGGEAADILARSGARVLISIGEFLGVDYPGMLRGHALRPCTSASFCAASARAPCPGRPSSCAPKTHPRPCLTRASPR